MLSSQPPWTGKPCASCNFRCSSNCVPGMLLAPTQLGGTVWLVMARELLAAVMCPIQVRVSTDSQVLPCPGAARWDGHSALGPPPPPSTRVPEWLFGPALAQLLDSEVNLLQQRHYFADKGPSSESFGFSSSHVRMWELDYKENWAPKNWCFFSLLFIYLF